MATIQGGAVSIASRTGQDWTERFPAIRDALESSKIRDATLDGEICALDQRGVARLFDMTFGDGHWTISREDPDFHQRIVSTVEPGRIVSDVQASEDAGATWRKDFDLLWERQGA